MDAGRVPQAVGCDCVDYPDCARPAALALAAVALTGNLRVGGVIVPGRPVPAPPSDVRVVAVPSPWESALSGLVEAVTAVSGSPAGDEAAGIGLQFELVESAAGPARRPAVGRHHVPARRIALRPVVPGRTGWVRGGISWSNVSYAGYGRSADERHVRLLREILVLATVGHGQQYFYGSQPQAVFLDSFGSRRIWDLLAEAQEI